jgi:hypothetical protein
MKFEDFISQGFARRTSKDTNLAKSLFTTAENDLKFLENLELNEFSTRKIVGNYYDTLRSILEAIAVLDGYKIYSHEAFTFYLKERGEDVISIKFERFRKIRNGINYYGQIVSVEEAVELIDEMKRIIKMLVDKYSKF